MGLHDGYTRVEAKVSQRGQIPLTRDEEADASCEWRGCELRREGGRTVTLHFELGKEYLVFTGGSSPEAKSVRSLTKLSGLHIAVVPLSRTMT
jgi:hypothetical protein